MPSATEIVRSHDRDMMKKYDQLYIATNRLMVILGAVGEIDSQHDAVSAVMAALYDIDGGARPKEGV